MIFFLPVFSRKISSAINRRTVRKNGLKILDLSVQVWDANRTKFCSQKKTLKIFYFSSSWQSLLTAIWFSRLTLRVSHWFFIRVLLLNSGSENFEPRIKKQQDFFLNMPSFEKRGQQILAKVGRINITRKYPDKISLKRWILKKYLPKHLNLLLKLLKRDYDGTKKDKSKSH